MSRRRQARSRPVTSCGVCEAPTTNYASLCGRCVKAFKADLSAVPSVEEDLGISCTNEKGATYSPMPKGGGAQPDLNWPAIEARRDLGWTLGRGAAYAARQSKEVAPPMATLAARAAFLRDRVTALSLDPLGAQLAMAVNDGLTRAREVIDLKLPRQYLGECACTGALYVEEGQDVAVCRGCGALAVAANLRDDRLAELDSQLCTAAEIARLVAHLGRRTDRDRIRKLIHNLAARGQIHAAPGWGDPRYSFGIARRLIAEHDRKSRLPNP